MLLHAREEHEVHPNHLGLPIAARTDLRGSQGQGHQHDVPIILHSHKCLEFHLKYSKAFPLAVISSLVRMSPESSGSSGGGYLPRPCH